MIKAGALYFAIVIALFIAVVSASLLVVAAQYRLMHLKEKRLTQLAQRVDSGIAWILADTLTYGLKNKTDLFSDSNAHLLIDTKQWGLFELISVKSFAGTDTLSRVFLSGALPDSTVLYLSDENRELSLSGDTHISGDVYLPKAGVQKSYAEGKKYTGKKLIYDGAEYESADSLPPVDHQILKQLEAMFDKSAHLPLVDNKVLTRSFLDSTLHLRLEPHALLADTHLSGNLVLYADSSVTIKASSSLEGLQIYAPFIKIEAGFKGNCQLFATDSILIGDKVFLSYPSVAAVINTHKTNRMSRIVLGNDVNLEGIIFNYEKLKPARHTSIRLGTRTTVNGEVFGTGVVWLGQDASIKGKLSCDRLVMQTADAFYDNFLIDVNLSHAARSRYYLSSSLFKLATERKVLKWLK